MMITDMSRVVATTLFFVFLFYRTAFSNAFVLKNHPINNPPRSSRVHRRDASSTTSSSSTTTTTSLLYKVLGAPQEGSDKPTVLEEGNNKIVTGNLNGSFRQRMEAKYDDGVERQLIMAASEQLQAKKAAAAAVAVL